MPLLWINGTFPLGSKELDLTFFKV